MGHVYKEGYFWRLKGSKALPGGGVACEASKSHVGKRKTDSEETQAKDHGKKRKRDDDSWCPSDDEEDDENGSSTSMREDNSTESYAAVTPFAAARAQRAFEKEDDENSLSVDV